MSEFDKMLRSNKLSAPGAPQNELENILNQIEPFSFFSQVKKSLKEREFWFGAGFTTALSTVVLVVSLNMLPQINPVEEGLEEIASLYSNEFSQVSLESKYSFIETNEPY